MTGKKIFSKKILPAFLVFLFLFNGMPHSAAAWSFKKLLPKSKAVHGIRHSVEYDLLTFRDKSKKYPLVLILHGRGEIPEDVFEKWRYEAAEHEVMLLVPAWSEVFQRDQNIESIKKLLKEITGRFPVDNNQLFLAGVSAGGRRAQEWIESSPDFWRGCLFAAYVPSEDLIQKAQTEKMPYLFFVYGAKDPAGQSEILKKSAEILKLKGQDVYLMIDPKAGHEVREEWLPKIFEWIKSSGGKTNQ